MRQQRTIKTGTTLSGIGLHTGEPATIVLGPAEAGRGIAFVRTDLPGRPEIDVRLENAITRERRTTLRRGDAEVETIEHLCSALLALGVDNCLVEIDGPEVPGLDGSALPFAEALLAAGIIEQGAPRKTIAVQEPIALHDGDTSITAFPHSGGLKISYALSYPSNGSKVSEYVSLDVDRDRFLEEIAPARTFCLEREARALQEAGLGRGASTANTLVIGDEGVVGNSFRLEEELARHKILDLLGDMALLGADLHAHVVAVRSGHAANRTLVSRLLEHTAELENKGRIQRDTGLDIKEILKIIPHRYPFLFVDRVIELEGYRRAVGIKNVSFNEPYFQGHWPGQPIMPGVLQVEALAQLAGVLFLRRLENTGKVAVLLAIDNIKFRRPVVPGDQVRLECETLFLKSRTGKVRGRALVDGELCCESVMKFMLMDA